MQQHHAEVVRTLNRIASAEHRAGDTDAVNEIRAYIDALRLPTPSVPGGAEAKIETPWPVYISSLTPLTQQSRDSSHVVQVSGRRSERSLYLHPHNNSNAQATFTVPQGAQRFKGEVTLADSVATSVGQLYFRVINDRGEVLWESKPVQSRDDTQRFDIDLGLTTTITLQVQTNDARRAHATWFEPHFEP